MRRKTAHRLVALVATTAALGLVTAVPSSEASSATHYTGTLSDQATWIADVPADWNGTLLLFSHGFGPLNAADAPDPATGQALLLAVQHRLDAGRWDSVARPDRLQASAAALALGGAAFIRYRPDPLTGNNGRFLP